MLTTITVAADIAGNARDQAVGTARAQGWARIAVFTVRQTGPRTYDVVLDVTR